jgi:hypothetical protein
MPLEVLFQNNNLKKKWKRQGRRVGATAGPTASMAVGGHATPPGPLPGHMRSPPPGQLGETRGPGSQPEPEEEPRAWPPGLGAAVLRPCHIALPCGPPPFGISSRVRLGATTELALSKF